MSRHALLLHTALCMIAALALACGESDGPAPPAPGAGDATIVSDDPGAAGAIETRLASHLFVPVGESRRIDDLGELLEVIHVTGRNPVEVQGPNLIARSDGASCLRFRYRATERENSVQTLCVVVVGEVGSCDGFDALTLDLERFLEAGRGTFVRGQANLLAQGEGHFYRLCTTGERRVRLQTTSRVLPPLYLHITDAHGDGPYSLGRNEFGQQRAGYVQTFAGQQITAPWLLSVSVEGDPAFRAGGFVFPDPRCELSPGCSSSPALVRAGDIVTVGTGFDVAGIQAVATDPAMQSTIAPFVREVTGLEWGDLPREPIDLRVKVMQRLANMQGLEQALLAFDALYGLRTRGVRVALQPHWSADDAGDECGRGPSARARCAPIEEALSQYEAARIAHLRDEGFALWVALTADYADTGTYDALGSTRPTLDLFEGAVVRVGPGERPVADLGRTLAEVARGVAAELDPTLAVVLAVPGPPIGEHLEGRVCEGEVCVSALDQSFAVSEAWLEAALDAFAAGRLVGFASALFEGSHFDIRDPQETVGGLQLNRLAETGYNHPILNLWRAHSGDVPEAPSGP